MCVYRIRRRGTFSVLLHPELKCGRPRTQWTREVLSYDVVVEVTDLDGRGFIIDQFDIVDIFEAYKVGRWRASCEALACSALRSILQLLSWRVSSVRVEVSPIPEAGATVIYRRGDPLPQLEAERLYGPPRQLLQPST